jgi:hypothetical protein
MREKACKGLGSGGKGLQNPHHEFREASWGPAKGRIPASPLSQCQTIPGNRYQIQGRLTTTRKKNTTERALPQAKFTPLIDQYLADMQ